MATFKKACKYALGGYIGIGCVNAACAWAGGWSSRTYSRKHPPKRPPLSLELIVICTIGTGVCIIAWPAFLDIYVPPRIYRKGTTKPIEGTTKDGTTKDDV